MMDTGALTARALAAGEGKPLRVLTDTVTIKLRGAETGGAFALVEVLSPPESGAPPHVHSREDETFCVIEGEFEFTVGDDVIRAGPGAYLFGPRGIVHSFKNVGTQSGRLLFILSPPGLERLFEEMDQMSEQGPPPPEKLMPHIATYGVEFLPPEGQ